MNFGATRSPPRRCTHLVLIVQTRLGDAVALDKQAARRLAWLAGVALLVILGLVAAALWSPRRARKN